MFNKEAKHEVELADRTVISLKDLLVYIKDNLIKERPDLFIVDGTVYSALFAPPSLFACRLSLTWLVSGGLASWCW